MNKPYEIIIAGVGGQGAITIAQLILGAAWKSGKKVLQSEIHGMSQRGGAVNAHVIFDDEEVTCPIVTEGSGDLLLALEPLECLRYLNFLSRDAVVISSTQPIVNMDNYPDLELLLSEVNNIKNISSIDTATLSKELNNRHAGNMILLGLASTYMPIDKNFWNETISERFKSKGDKVIEKNLEAFEYGKKLRLN
jgi:indolepyruvate ferredoxin oxidoreductase beta subunit